MAVQLDPPKDPPLVRNIPTYPLQTIVRTMLAAVCVAFALYLVYLLRKPISWVLIAIFLAVALAAPVNLLTAACAAGSRSRSSISGCWPCRSGSPRWSSRRS